MFDLRQESQYGKRCEYLLHNLLARIHRDGGHHTEKVGLEQSVKDAEDEVVRLIAMFDSGWDE